MSYNPRQPTEFLKEKFKAMFEPVGGVFKRNRRVWKNLYENLVFMKLVTEDEILEITGFSLGDDNEYQYNESAINILVDYIVENKLEMLEEVSNFCAWDVDGTLTRDEGAKAEYENKFFHQIGNKIERQERVRSEAKDFITQTHDNAVKHIVLSKGKTEHVQLVLQTLLGEGWDSKIDIYMQVNHRYTKENERGLAILAQVAVVYFPTLKPLYYWGVENCQEVDYDTCIIEPSHLDFLYKIGKNLIENGYVKLHAFDDSKNNIANISKHIGENAAHKVEPNSHNDSLKNYFPAVLEDFGINNNQQVANNNNESELEQVGSLTQPAAFFNEPVQKGKGKLEEEFNNLSLSFDK